LKGDGKGSV